MLLPQVDIEICMVGPEIPCEMDGTSVTVSESTDTHGPFNHITDLGIICLKLQAL